MKLNFFFLKVESYMKTLMITKLWNALFVTVKSNHIGNHVTMASEQPVMCVELTGRSRNLLINFLVLEY